MTNRASKIICNAGCPFYRVPTSTETLPHRKPASAGTWEKFEIIWLWNKLKWRLHWLHDSSGCRFHSKKSCCLPGTVTLRNRYVIADVTVLTPVFSSALRIGPNFVQGANFELTVQYLCFLYNDELKQTALCANTSVRPSACDQASVSDEKCCILFVNISTTRCPPSNLYLQVKLRTSTGIRT